MRSSTTRIPPHHYNATPTATHQPLNKQPRTIPAGSIKLAHPNALLVVMTGEDDVITNDDGVDMIFRIQYDKDKMGRNPYANFYQYVAQIALLSRLNAMVGGGVRGEGL